MNFKSLALSAVVALSTLGGVAEAAPSTCMLRDSRDFKEFTCDHSLRTNTNGDNVNDIVFFVNGKRYDMSIVVWSDDGAITYAETFINGDRDVAEAYRAKNGSLCVSQNDTQFCWFVS